jgi:hypothetical protein
MRYARVSTDAEPADVPVNQRYDSGDAFSILCYGCKGSRTFMTANE